LADVDQIVDRATVIFRAGTARHSNRWLPDTTGTGEHRSIIARMFSQPVGSASQASTTDKSSPPAERAGPAHAATRASELAQRRPSLIDSPGDNGVIRAMGLPVASRLVMRVRPRRPTPGRLVDDAMHHVNTLRVDPSNAGMHGHHVAFKQLLLE
jgi:hypothetical protein